MIVKHLTRYATTKTLTERLKNLFCLKYSPSFCSLRAFLKSLAMGTNRSNMNNCTPPETQLRMRVKSTTWLARSYYLVSLPMQK